MTCSCSIGPTMVFIDFYLPLLWFSGLITLSFPLANLKKGKKLIVSYLRVLAREIRKDL